MDVLFARWQMGVSRGFHIVFAWIGIAMPVLMVMAEIHLLDHGHLVTATGNSDTHDLTPRADYPRNYVQTAADGRMERGPEAIAIALRHHRAFFTIGPLVSMKIAAAGVGDLVTVHGTTTVDPLVIAAPWVSTPRAHDYVGGKIVQTIDLDPTATSAVRLRRTITRDVSHDTYAVLRVKSERLLPRALANPMFATVTACSLRAPGR